MVVGFLPSAVFIFFAYGVGVGLLCLLFSVAGFFLVFGFWFFLLSLLFGWLCYLFSC